ncbi:MAG: hypothetical protein ACI4BH_06780 [Muribaculaceae bacterium]
MENSIELNEMREQLAILNKKLSDQAIVNERLIRASVGKNVKNINKDSRMMIMLALVGIVCIIADHYLVNWSWPFTIVTTVFMMVAIAFNFYCRSGLTLERAYTSDLMETRLAALRFKRFQTRWLMFGIPFIICWLIWLVYETLNLTPNPEPIIIGCAVGAVIGGVIGINQYLRAQRQASEIISEIESYRNDETPTQE